MAHSRGDIVEVQFRLPPDGRTENHPVVILSNTEINNFEEGFTAVMMSTTNPDDEFSFPVLDEMLNLPYADGKHREVRIHLIGSFINKDVIKSTRNRTFIKSQHLRRIITQINEITFGFDVNV